MAPSIPSIGGGEREAFPLGGMGGGSRSPADFFGMYLLPPPLFITTLL